jgi:hypothetical protein
VSDKYTTEDMIAYVQRWKNCCASPYIDDESDEDMQKCIDIERTIIARLRAADALYEATILDYMVRVSPGVSHYDIMPKKLRKAIADFEGVA